MCVFNMLVFDTNSRNSVAGLNRLSPSVITDFGNGPPQPEKLKFDIVNFVAFLALILNSLMQ